MSNHFLHENLFHVKYRMSLESFNRLLEMLRPELKLKEKYAIMSGMHPITCEVMMHCTIHYLAGGSFHDIHATVSISKPSFYRLIWHTIHCINRCEALDINLPKPEELNYTREGFQRISKDGVMNGCIGALDGYLMRITAPSYAECGNVGAYFSGHYCTYGVNVQVMCDADCLFFTLFVLRLLEKLTIALQFVRPSSLLGFFHCHQDILLLPPTPFQNI
jgi:hypothetical protein